MPKIIDITGKRFGRLLVISRAINKGKSICWNCICDCGNTVIKRTTNLRYGDTKSCGCYFIEEKRNRFKDITNFRSGRLIVLRKIGSIKNIINWECICDCGNKTIVSYYNIKKQLVRSCGCLQKESSALSGKKGAYKISGSKSYLYKPDLTDEERASKRNFVELREWRKSTFERDDYTCQLCYKKGGKICAHHLNNWANFKDLRFKLDNGITLCKIHHKEFHDSLGGFRKPCNKEDFEKFKAQYYLNRKITNLESLEK